ncbi:MAG: CBS domain-containing protein [Verrucomicrobia bacterium]|nr:CBS domain-containing protein [Verrucomicrobiota bacterium]
MIADPISVPPNISIKDFVENYVYQSYHHFYPVTDNGVLLGYIGIHEVKSIPHTAWEKTLVNEVMVSNITSITVTAETSALDALNLMNQSDSPMLMVVDGPKLMGIITNQNLFKFISLKLELEGG